MAQIPVHGLLDALLEGEARRPAKFPPDPAGVNGVAAVVPLPVAHKGDERPPGGSAGQRRHFPVQKVAEQFHDLQILLFVVAADIVGLECFPKTKETKGLIESPLSLDRKSVV